MLRFLSRLLGLWLLAGALVALVADGARSIAAGSLVTTALGQLWFSASPGSLNAFQAAVQRYVHPLLWESVIVWILLAPAFAVAGALAVVLLFAGQRKRIPEMELDRR